MNTYRLSMFFHIYIYIRHVKDHIDTYLQKHKYVGTNITYMHTDMHIRIIKYTYQHTYTQNCLHE